MKTLADLIDAAERLERLASDARADCAATQRRLEELRRIDDAEHSELLAGFVRLRAQLRGMEGRR
jgi:hypothetical protein